MDKYYTPDLKEFHIGCRFVTKTFPDGTIMHHEMNYKTYLSWGRTNTLYNGIIDGKILMKYLDEDDIEELGWEKILSSVSYEAVHEVVYRYTSDNVYDLSISEGGITIYVRESDDNLFKGQLKNYNELKTLMQWLRL